MQFVRGQYDLRAGFRIRERIVMLERNLQMLADKIEFVRRQAPGLPRQLHRATKRQRRHRQARRITARLQNAFIKRSIVRDEMVGTVPIFVQRRPDFAKRGRTFDVFPFNAVNVGELKPRARRTNQGVGFGDDLVVLDAHERNRTGAVGAVISGLEIYGNEVHGFMNHGGHGTFFRQDEQDLLQDL